MKLAALTKALYACTIHRTDTLSGYLDKFENLIREFYLFRGQLSDQQSARMLIGSIPTLSETTTELIHTQVVPLTRQGVCDYLREYETRQGWISPAMKEANAAIVSSGNPPRHSGGKARCTKDHCYGPHPEKECWSKPENAKKKEDFISRKYGDKSNQPSGSSAVVIKGRKKLSQASANVSTLEPETQIISIHSSFEDVSVNSTSQEPSAATVSSTQKSLWALHDTGATHSMFNDILIFDKSSLKPVTDSNRRLKLAGGGMSLSVHSEGTVRLKAGDGTVFELKDCLYIPELAQNLISGGKLRQKGVREYFDDGDNSSFSLVLNDVALFNGYIGSNGLMNVQLEPVSNIFSTVNVSNKSDVT